MSLAKSNRSSQKLPVHGRIDTNSRDQFRMCASLDDSSPLKHKHAIGVMHRA